MKLAIGEKEIEVRPLSAGRMEQFFDRLEANRQFVEANPDKIWETLKRNVDLCADMMVSALNGTGGLSVEQIKDLVPHHEVNDWVIYLIHGPAALEKKRANDRQTQIPISLPPVSAP